MTEAKKTKQKPKSKKAEGGRKIRSSDSTRVTESKVVRDHNFQRFCPDQALVIDRIDDLELSLLIHEKRPNLVEFGDSSGFGESNGSFHIEAEMCEVGRVRLEYDKAINLSMNILKTVFEMGAINVEAFDSAIAELKSATPKNQKT